ncbi:hypothetical protein ISN45_Aa01g017410 [Arabidopsis thaliana x Arabidopsis arenosa]|uniref:Uncharacterized protein n=1 Tax=Arabidopsis thaliana x Arabidopsis arenosa TaxID=1240361 RepID=A0A8T2C1R8_9BRAS|nr:hypothetical protein ISN45_Aa01g017410 [Arabidopsis thaliana x Arabidopsis arenosa]
MTSPTYTLLCIRSFMFLLCFSIAFGRKNLQDKLGNTLFSSKPIEATELRAALVTNSEATDISSSIGLGEVGSQEMHHIYIGTSKQDNINSVPRKIIRGTVSISFSFPIIKIQVPILKPNITVVDINQLNEEEMVKGIVITPTKTNEFGISLGNDGAELGYSYQ